MIDLESLLSLPESKTLEFKRDLSSLKPILKTLVAFANTAGGILIIGKSPEGEITGINDIFLSEEKIANAIAENIRLTLLPEIEISSHSGKTLLVIRVSHWPGPFYFKGEGKPRGVYIRLGSTSRPAGPELLAELQRSILRQSFDEQPLGDLTNESLEIDQIHSVFEKVNKSVDEKKMRSLGLMTPIGSVSKPSVGAILMFGRAEDRTRLFPDARVRCARFHGQDKSIILDRYDVGGGLLDALEEVPHFISRNTRLMAEIKGMRREDIPEYPTIAVREALVNALAHADYSLTGSCIQVAIYDDRLEITNPGMLPFGFTLDNLKAGISHVRNRVIARTFSELGLMEEWGSGYQRIKQACQEGGYPLPRWEEIGAAIRITFYPHTPPSTARDFEDLSKRHKALLKLFEGGASFSFRELYDLFKEEVSERTLRYELAKLRKRGLLTTEGSGPTTRWRVM